jgi:uncharacterized protein (TIGR02246 family)
MADELLDTLLDIERSGWDALCDGAGGPFYRQLMTSDAVMVLADGTVLDRDEVLASLENAPPWASYRTEDARLVRAGAATAILVYRGTASGKGDAPSFGAMMASVYQRVDGQWRLALYQQTVLP